MTTEANPRELLPPVQSFEVHFRARERVRLAGWLGSTLHGALGGAIRALTCSPRCEALHEQEPGRCPYSRLFEQPSAPEGTPAWLAAMASPPLVLRPPSPGPERVLGTGEDLRFGLTLLGSRVDDPGYLLAGIERMAARGLGKGRGRLELVSVTSGGEAVWQAGQVVGSPRPARPPDAPPGRTLLRAVTPLRILRDGEPVAPRFEDLVAAAARRVLSAGAFFGERRDDVSVREIVQRATEHPARVHATWERFEVMRWSSRQEKAHPAVGHLGEAEIDDLGPGGPWLAAAQVVGIGKRTGFGFGHYELRPA